MFRRQTFYVLVITARSRYESAPVVDMFWSARSTHNLGMNFIYKEMAVLELKFHYEIKDWDFLTAGSLIQNNEYWILTHCESRRQRRLATIVYANVQDIFFSFSRNIFRSETVHLFLRIILESFKLHYFFLTSNTRNGYFAVRTQIRSDASSC